MRQTQRQRCLSHRRRPTLSLPCSAGAPGSEGSDCTHANMCCQLFGLGHGLNCRPNGCQVHLHCVVSRCGAVHPLEIAFFTLAWWFYCSEKPTSHCDDRFRYKCRDAATHKTGPHFWAGRGPPCVTGQRSAHKRSRRRNPGTSRCSQGAPKRRPAPTARMARRQNIAVSALNMVLLVRKPRIHELSSDSFY